MRSLKHPLPVIERSSKAGFTLLEVLVATTIFVLLMGLLLSLTSEASKLWQQAENQKARRQVARIILETMGRDLAAAAFSANTNSVQFLLNSQSAMGSPNLNPNAAFWQAPIPGDFPPGTLSEVGYFVQWINARPALCRYHVPATASDSLFSSNSAKWTDWLNPTKIKEYAPGLNNTNTYDGLLAENVLGLWITLYDSTNGILPNYNSRSNTTRPATAEIGIAIIDPRTARRITNAAQIQGLYSTNAETFVAALPANLREGVQIFRSRVQIQAPH